mgnify:FL=1
MWVKTNSKIKMLSINIDKMTRYIINYPKTIPFYYLDDSVSRTFAIGNIMNTLPNKPTSSKYNFDVYIIDDSNMYKPTIGVVKFTNEEYDGNFSWIDENIPFSFQKNRFILNYKKSFDIDEIIRQAKYTLRDSYMWLTMLIN